jgi:hypothetical protein
VSLVVLRCSVGRGVYVAIIIDNENGGYSLCAGLLAFLLSLVIRTFGLQLLPLFVCPSL